MPVTDEGFWKIYKDHEGCRVADDVGKNLAPKAAALLLSLTVLGVLVAHAACTTGSSSARPDPDLASKGNSTSPSGGDKSSRYMGASKAAPIVTPTATAFDDDPSDQFIGASKSGTIVRTKPKSRPAPQPQAAPPNPNAK